MDIKTLKCHGSGNDFILIDEITNDYNFSEEDRVEITKNLCDRKMSVGADGVLFVLNSSKGHGRMRIFNADGSEPEMCGNGLRCVGRYVMELVNKKEVLIETMKTVYTVKKVENIFKGVATIEIIIDSVSFEAGDLPMISDEHEVSMKKVEKLSDTLLFSAISITNPHLVAIVDEISEGQLQEVGYKANNTPEILPKGVNVNFVKVIDGQNIYVKTYERGVGLTKACGTGMTASVISAVINGKCAMNEEINIFNDGGMIKCTVCNNDKGYFVKFVGNATYQFTGNFKYTKPLPKHPIHYDYDSYKAETECYEKMFLYTREIIKKVL